MPKILMPIGDATEALDTFYAYYRLPEDDYEVVVAGPEVRLYHTVLHEISKPPKRFESYSANAATSDVQY
mgnify:CR=1 FL=1